MPERKSVLRQENYLIIPLKTFFGDTLGGGYAFAFCSKPIPLQAIMPLKIAYEGTQER